ncbi:MAG: hypothetical protein ABIN89_27235, partial [Chitinophagaceae bacterium]
RALNRYMQTLDPYHINRQALVHHIIQLLSDSTLTTLRIENDQSANELIIKEILQSMVPLPMKSCENIGHLLENLAGNDTRAISIIQKYLREKKLSGYWEKYMPVLILFATLLLCLLIYLVSSGYEV